MVIKELRVSAGMTQAQLAKKMNVGSILINLSGRGDKDMDYVIEHYGIR